MPKQHFNGDANYLQPGSKLKKHSLAMHIIYGSKVCQSNTQVVMLITDGNEVCRSNTPVVMHMINEFCQSALQHFSSDAH